MSYNCKHGIEEAFHCFDCEYAFKRTGRLHDEFKTWEFYWSKIHGRSPCAEDGWLADKYRLDARAEIAKLEAVVEAAAALVGQWEVEHDCPDCEAKAEAMGGRCDPTCDICLGRWAVAHDAYDDACKALGEK